MPWWMPPLLTVQTALLLPGLYLAFLTLAGLRYRSSEAPSSQLPDARALRLAVLVPAHNEEELLPHLLWSLDSGTYPRDRYDVFVVADNCTDRTAEVARSAGAMVHVREDLDHVGKGYALQWLIQRINPAEAPYEGYVFLDADCEVSPDFLSVMAARLAGGHRAVQAYYTAASPFESPVSTLRYAALVLKHNVRPRGRAVLGLPCGLFGTGMAFSREIIARHGWSAFTLAEDIEYQLRLADEDVYVAFEPSATVISVMPSSLRQAKSQNLRWERGRLRLALRWGPRLLVSAVRQRSWRKADIFIEQALPPLSVLGALVAAMLAVATIAGHGPLRLLGGATAAAFGIHVLGGLFIARAPIRVYRAFLFAPLFVLWKLSVYFLALVPGSGRWVRTQRS